MIHLPIGRRNEQAFDRIGERWKVRRPFKAADVVVSFLETKASRLDGLPLSFESMCSGTNLP